MKSDFRIENIKRLAVVGEKGTNRKRIEKKFVSSYPSENRPNFLSTLANQELELQGSL